jgi:hypothetical protein
METSFCIETLDEALFRNEKPEIFNTDQGSQFTQRGLHRAAKRKSKNFHLMKKQKLSEQPGPLHLLSLR